MATIKALIRTQKTNKPVKVRLRLGVSREITFYAVTDIEVLPTQWSSAKQELKAKVIPTGTLGREEINAQINTLKARALDLYEKLPVKTGLPSDWLSNAILATPRVQQARADISSFFEVYDKYTASLKVSPLRMKHLKATRDMLRRYSDIYGSLELYSITLDTLQSFETFLRNEHTIQLLHPTVYVKVRAVKQRGQNTINTKMNMLRAFLYWCVKSKLILQSPFFEYEFSPDIYGDPIPLLATEVDLLYALENVPDHLAITRDIFCLHCFMGCRVGDLVSLCKENLQGDIVSYVAEKTVKDNPVTVYVPLGSRALALIKKYDFPDGKLMPFFNVNGENGYNKRIKELCLFAKLDRTVVVINTLTRKPESLPLHKVVSTHTARRTFINSNYAKTQDPALISMMTGHSKNSRAFARYRNIDLDILREQVTKAFEKE